MATLAEQQLLFTDATLLSKMQAAVVVAAQAVYTEPANTANHADRLKWAKATLLNPAAAAAAILPAVVAANNSGTSAQISGASDAAIQTAVNNVVNLFIV